MLTKLQRYTAYVIMLAEAEYTINLGFCGLIDFTFDISIDNDTVFGNLKLYFPELANKVKYDMNEDVFLFDNWKQRRQALKQCIEETSPDK